MRDMRLSDLYQKLDSEGRKSLANKIGMSEGFLFQVATRWRRKRPSIVRINEICKLDRRLTKKDLLDEFFPEIGR